VSAFLNDEAEARRIITSWCENDGKISVHPVYGTEGVTHLDEKVLADLISHDAIAARLWMFLETQNIQPGETSTFPIF